MAVLGHVAILKSDLAGDKIQAPFSFESMREKISCEGVYPLSHGSCDPGTPFVCYTALMSMLDKLHKTITFSHHLESPEGIRKQALLLDRKDHLDLLRAWQSTELV